MVDRIRADHRLWRQTARTAEQTERQPDAGKRHPGAFGADSRHALPLPVRRRKPERQNRRRRPHLHDVPEPDDRAGHLRERAGAPADGRRPAARLSCLRARLGRGHQRVRRQLDARPRAETARPAAAAPAIACSTRSSSARSRGPATRRTSDWTPTWRPATAAEQWETNYVGIPASGTPSTAPFGSPLARSSGGPQHLRLRQRHPLRPLLLRRVDRDSGPSAERQPRPGAEGLDPENRARNPRVTSASRCPMTAATSSSARPRNSRPRPPKAT